MPSSSKLASRRGRDLGLGLLSVILRWTGVYWMYEKWLMHQVESRSMPRHVSLILDGSSNWDASRDRRQQLEPRFGAEAMEKLLDWCLELGIETVTLYVLSTESLRKGAHKARRLLESLKRKIRESRVNKKIHDNQVKVTMFGKTELLPQDIRLELKKLQEATEDYRNHFLNIAVAYGGRTEIVDAISRIAKKVSSGLVDPDEIDEGTIGDHLYTAGLPHPDPDLIIRMSGEERISDFLLWQSAYSEFIFLDVYWPAFRKIDLLRAIRTYQSITRRRGL